MTVTLSPVFGAAGQVFNNNGFPLSGGQIFTYLAGTSTNATTYTTSVGNIAHSNPIILDAAGRIPGGGEIWLNIGFGYKFVIEDSTGALIGTYDNIPSSAQPPAANDADSIMYEQGYTVTAGNFVIGNTYRILSVGNTDFVAIGAVSNTVGVYFIATGVGSGSGTAKLSQTVQYKLRQTISPKDFGAVGNGVTDDTAAIQAAVAYAQSLVTASPLYPSTKNIGGVIIDGGNANYAISAAIVENVGCITFANMCISPKFTSAGSYPGGYNACFVLGSGGWGTQQSVVTYRTNMTNIVISPGNYPYANYLTYAIIISGLRNAVFSNISVTQQFAAMWLENVSEVSVNDVFSVGNVYGYVLDSRMSGTSVLGFSYGWNDVANNNWNNCFATYSQHSGWVCMSIRQNRLIGCGSSYWNQSPLTTPPLGLPVAGQRD